MTNLSRARAAGRAASAIALGALLCLSAGCGSRSAARVGSTPEQRRDAALRLGASRDPAAVPELARLLGDPAEIVRATAAGELGRVGHASAVAPLSARLAAERRAFVRKEIAYALGRVGDPSAIASLEAWLARERDREVRGAVVWALAEIGSPASVAPLVAALGDPDELVRRHAVRGLGMTRAEGALPLVVDRLERDASADVRRHAAEALGRIGDPAARAALEAALGDSDPYVANEADRALERLGIPSNPVPQEVAP